VGPRHLAAIVAVATESSSSPQDYKKLLSEQRDLVHVTVEVNKV
jgi:hypothetical protein